MAGAEDLCRGENIGLSSYHSSSTLYPFLLPFAFGGGRGEARGNEGNKPQANGKVLTKL
jgi:hypothetical protein